MIVKHTNLSDALSELSDERIEEALALDTADALQKAKREEKSLRARVRSRNFKRWLPLPVCAAVCLAVLLPLYFSSGAHDPAHDQPGGTTVQIANPWIYVETVNEVADRMQISVPTLPLGKTALHCAVLQPEAAKTSSSMGDIIFTDGSRLRLAKLADGAARPTEDQMAQYGGFHGAERVGTDTLCGVRVYRFRTSAGDVAAWIQGNMYYCYEFIGPEDLESLVEALSGSRK